MKGINELKGVTVLDVPSDLFVAELATFLEKSGNFENPKVQEDTHSYNSGQPS